MELKESLEQSIIGAILFENRFIEVADMLTEMNFSSDLNKTIWRTCVHLFPNTPISSRSVAKHCEVSKYYLARCEANATYNIRYDALVLCELTLRQSFIDALYAALEKEQDTTRKSCLQESIDEALDSAHDVFEMISIITKYLLDSGIEDPRIINFQNNIDKRIALMKKKVAIDTLFKHCNSLTLIPHDSLTKMAMNKCVDLIKLILSTPKLNEETANKILSI